MMADPLPPRTKTQTIIVFALILVVLAALGVFAYFATSARPVTTVILVRHAEKNIEPNNPDPDLSPAGQARAQDLVHVLGKTGITAIYASQYKRTQQTAQPLASRLGLTVSQVESSKTDDLVRQISTGHRGGVVFVAGHNNTVPAIIAALGGGAFPIIPENEFDNMFIVTVDRSGRARVVSLKYGDASPTGGGSGTMVP